MKSRTSRRRGGIGGLRARPELPIATHLPTASSTTGFPEAWSQRIGSPPKSANGLGNDPISISARVITRTLFVVRLLPAIDHFLDLLRKDS